MLQALEVTQGDFFTNPEITGPVINNDNGSAFYELRLSLGTDPQQGNGTLATITFQAGSPGITVVDFGADTGVGASQEDVNVIAALIPATIDIQGSIVTPSPSPTPESGDEGTGTPTPTPTDGGLGGGGTTPTPTPTITATPSATPTPTPSTLPDTATITPTYILAGLGMILMLSAALLLAL